jgi:benzylsuccinate CoA-transferase BbsE subunit
VLGSCRVVDATDRLGWLAGRLLADLGAQVAKLEAPDADLSSPHWRAYNVNKTVVRTEPSGSTLRELASDADVLLTTHGDTSLLDANPKLVLVCITPFGLSGPKSALARLDLRSWPQAVRCRRGRARRHAAARERAAACLGGSASCARRPGGVVLAKKKRQGQLVDVSAQAAVITALSHAPAFVDIAGVSPSRAGSFVTGRSEAARAFACSGPAATAGSTSSSTAGSPAGAPTSSWSHGCESRGAGLGALAAHDWTRWDPRSRRRRRSTRWKRRSRSFWFFNEKQFSEGAHQREMLGYPVSTVADIAADPQLAARGFWQDVPGPGGGLERHCGAFVIVDGKRARGLAQKTLQYAAST